jgi:hypothetical protein
MKLSKTMKHLRVGLLAAGAALILAGPLSAQSSAGANHGKAGVAINGGTGSSANVDNMALTGVSSDADNSGGTGMGTNNANNAGTGTGSGTLGQNAGTGMGLGNTYGPGYGTNTVYRPSAGGYGLWGLMGLIGLFGLLRGDRSRVIPSTPSYTRTEEYTRPRA